MKQEQSGDGTPGVAAKKPFPTRSFLAILLVGAWVRYKFLADFPVAFGHSDTGQYMDPVVTLLKDHVFVPSQFRVVGTYSYFVYFIIKYLGSTPYAVVIVQTFLGLCSGIVGFAILYRLLGSGLIANLGMLVILLLPRCLYYEHIVLTDSLYVFLLLVFFLVALLLHEKIGWFTALLLGTISGLLILSRGQGILALPLGALLILHVLWKNSVRLRLWPAYVLLFALPQAVMLGAYIRNNLKYNDFPGLSISGTCTWFWIGAGRFIDFDSPRQSELKNYVRGYVQSANEFYSGREEWGIHEEALRAGKLPFVIEYHELFHENLRRMDEAEREVALEATLTHPLAVLYRLYWNSVQLFWHTTSLRQTKDIRDHYLVPDGKFLRIEPDKEPGANRNGLVSLRRMLLPRRLLDGFQPYLPGGYYQSTNAMTTTDYILHYLSLGLANYRVFSFCLYVSLITLLLTRDRRTPYYVLVLAYTFAHGALTLLLINTLVDRYFIPTEPLIVILFAAACATFARLSARARLTVLSALCAAPLIYAAGHWLFSLVPLPYPLPIDKPILGLDLGVVVEHQRTVLSVLFGLACAIAFLGWIRLGRFAPLAPDPSGAARAGE